MNEPNCHLMLFIINKCFNLSSIFKAFSYFTAMDCKYKQDLFKAPKSENMSEISLILSAVPVRNTVKSLYR